MTITYQMIKERAVQDARDAMPDLPKLPERQIFLDSARGVYIPQNFAESVNRDTVSGVDMSDLDYLAVGPDQEHYWDTWADILDECILTESNGQSWRLYQDGDLFLVPSNAIDAWESFIDDVKSIDPYDMGNWDWVIYYHHAIALCLAVPGDVLSQAESELADMGGMHGDVTLHGLACQLAALIVQREISDAVETVRDELLELANNAMEGL